MNPDRRTLLGGSAAALLGGSVNAVAASDDDAELIRRCHRFAEYELESWYQYVMAPEDVADQLPYEPDWESVRWIIETAATTPAGWCAKALALSAWDRDIYDDEPEERTTQTTMLAALLREMVAPARNAIVARLAAQYGPLPERYTPEGIWLGWSGSAPG